MTSRLTAAFVAAGVILGIAAPSTAIASPAPQGGGWDAGAPQPGPGQRPVRPGPAGRGRAGAPDLPADADLMSVQQVEQYFDALVLNQARRQLQLSEDQFLRFGARLQRLQTARRQLQRRRAAAIRDLTALAGPNATASDEVLSQRLRDLETVVSEGTRQVTLAYEDIDAMLSVPQRARFRVFEDLMERRKLDLLARARARAQAGAGEFVPPPVPPR